MILGFKTKFQDGTPTNFQALILADIKKHSIRNGNRWKAGMSIQMATGVRTKKYNQFNDGVFCADLQRCVSTQEIVFDFNNRASKYYYHSRSRRRFIYYEIFVDGHELDRTEIAQLTKNDGFDYANRFVNWFYENRNKETNTFTGQIIHWTNIRY